MNTKQTIDFITGSTNKFAEMTQEEKNTISMRGIAAQKLLEFLEKRSL